MRKKLVYLLLTILIFITMVSACVGRQEGRNSMSIPLEQARYAMNLAFSWRIVIDGEERIITIRESRAPVIERIPPFENPLYTELVFVHNEEEAVGFPDSTVVAWPYSRDVAQGLVNGFNLGVLRGEIDLADFGLSYPIMPENLVDDWESINNLHRYISERNLIGTLSFALRDGADAFLDAPEFNTE